MEREVEKCLDGTRAGLCGVVGLLGVVGAWPEVVVVVPEEPPPVPEVVFVCELARKRD